MSMKTTEYSNWSVVARFGSVVKFFTVRACDSAAAIADVTEAYGPFELVQIGRR